MKQVTFAKLERPEYVEYTRRIRNIAAYHGCEVTLVDAERVWINYSDSMAAGWMTLPEDDDEVWECIKQLFYEAEGYQ